MHSLPTQLLPAVPHIAFGVFDLALPNIVAWLAIDLALLAAAWIRIPAFLETTDEADG